MPFINLKLAGIGVLLVSFIAFAMHYDHLKQQNKILSADNEQYANNAKVAAQQVKLADEARNSYLNKLTEAKNEITDLRGRVDSGAVKLHIKATCPKVPATPTNTTRIIAATPELTADARQAYWDLRNEMNQCPAQLALAIKTLQDDRK